MVLLYFVFISYKINRDNSNVSSFIVVVVSSYLSIPRQFKTDVVVRCCWSAVDEQVANQRARAFVGKLARVVDLIHAITVPT